MAMCLVCTEGCGLLAEQKWLRRMTLLSTWGKGMMLELHTEAVYTTSMRTEELDSAARVCKIVDGCGDGLHWLQWLAQRIAHVARWYSIMRESIDPKVTEMLLSKERKNRQSKLADSLAKSTYSLVL
eukprot:711523-Amphidinium_carterae.1